MRLRCVTIRYEKLWLSFVMGSCFVVVVLFFLFFLPTHRKQLQPQRQLLCPGKNEDESVSWWAEGDCAGLEHSSVQPSFYEGLDSGVRCTAFNLQAVLYSLPLLVLLSCVCVPVCLSFFDFASSRHTHSHTLHLITLYMLLVTAWRLLVVYSLFSVYLSIYSFSRSLHTQKKQARITTDFVCILRDVSFGLLCSQHAIDR